MRIFLCSRKDDDVTMNASMMMFSVGKIYERKMQHMKLQSAARSKSKRITYKNYIVLEDKNKQSSKCSFYILLCCVIRQAAFMADSGNRSNTLFVLLN